jgi:glycosyltransferase involved in cell wall biosynthesis
MKILMLLENEFPPDERVEKEIQTLTEQGHTVHVLCANRGSRPALEELDGFTIHRIRISRLMFKLSALILILPFYKKMWYKSALGLYKKFHFNAVHVHDLPLSIVGMKLKKKYGVKLICDQHEYYSNWIVDTAHYNTFTGKIVKLLSSWKKYERKALNYADHIITVEQPLKQIYVEEYQLGTEKISVLPNTPSRGLFQSSSVDASLFNQYKDKFTLLYFGGIDILRGIDYIIKAIPEIVKTIPEFKFVLAGKVRRDYDPIRSAEKLGVEKYVDYIGWIDRKDLSSLIQVSDLGVFTPVSDRAEINKTIATKNYQFLVMSKPMMVGRAEYMKAFTENNNIGFSVNECEPDEIIRGIIEYYQNKERRETMIASCKEIAANYYWEYTSKSLTDYYSSLNK